MNLDPTTIEVVTFDLDDTFWPIMPTIIRAERILHDWLAERYPRITDRYSMETMRERRMQMVQQHPDLIHDLTALRIKSLELLAEECGYSTELALPAFQVMWEARNQVDIFDDVIPILEQLSQHYVIGAITNGNASLERIGLGEYFDFCISARDVGISKPAAEIYQAATDAASVHPSKILHIGDDPHCDVIGAANIGMKPVWLNRDSKPWPIEKHNRVPHIEIATLVELELLLFNNK